MALIWAGGVIGLAIVAALLRLLMGLAGLTGHRIDALSAQISISMRQPLGIIPISASRGLRHNTATTAINDKTAATTGKTRPINSTIILASEVNEQATKSTSSQ
jgi:hypothetical protein